MRQEGNTFSPQLPESSEYSASLYESHREFKASLEKVAKHIVGEGAPMTFALYGDWGTGKSTALEYLQGIIHKQDEAITFSWCQAPLWARYQDERSALALQILRGVERGIPASVADVLASLLQYDLNVARGQSEQDDYDLAASLALLKVLESIPHAPPVVEDWIRRSITRNGPIRHVVMLDDLDRCDPAFVARLLKATNHWTTEIDHGEHRGASIYFILACQEEFLISSQAQGGEVKDPRQALEKYVHVTVNIPRLLNRPGDAANYLRMLVKRLSGLPEDARDHLAAMIDASARDYPDGLLAPLLRVGDQLTTPRAVKTRLNLALTEIDYEQLDDETLVKEWIIKAFWPDFWTNQYRTLVMNFQESSPASTGYQGSRDAEIDRIRIKNLPSDVLAVRFHPIQTVGARLRGLLDMSDDALGEALVHIGTEVRADLTDVKPQLAIYLATDPPWPAQPTAGRSAAFPVAEYGRTQQSSAEKSLGRGTLPGYRSPEPLAPDSTASDTSEVAHAIPQSSDVEIPSDPDDQIFFYYLLADAAEDRHDRETMLGSLSRLLELARQIGSRTSHGTDIGNAALIAERANLDEMAFELHHIARAAAPQHFNIMQNYIDFILDKEISSEYREARDLYHVLMADGKDQRPLRTLIIGMRLDAMETGSIPNLEERSNALLSMLFEEPLTNRLIDLAKIPGNVLGYETIESACKIVAEKSTSLSNRITALRVFTAAMGRSNNPAHEHEVVDVCRWMVGVGLACQGSDEMYATILFNLGIQLGALGYRMAATLIHAEAYKINPMSSEFRRVMASSLEILNRNEDATAVLLGRPVNTDDIQPEELPEFLSTIDGADRWWEQLPIGKNPPCPTKLPWLIPSKFITEDKHGDNAS